MDRFSPDYQDDLDDYLAGGMSTPSQPGNLANDEARQAYIDQLTAQLLATLKLDIPQPDFRTAQAPPYPRRGELMEPWDPVGGAEAPPMAPRPRPAGRGNRLMEPWE